MMSVRTAAVVIVLGLLGLGLAYLLLADTPPPTEVVEAPPAAPAAEAPQFRSERTALQPPPGAEPSPPNRDEPLSAGRITADDRRQMNFAVDDMLKVVRSECLQPWVNGLDHNAEFVFDVVLADGRVMDIGMRPLTLEVPPEIVRCVADRAWLAEWPEFAVTGDLRLQRSIEMNPHR